VESSASVHPADRHFPGNVAGVSLVELLWGLGMPPLFESAFLQLFLHRLGASSLLIGLIPSLAAAGNALSSLFSYPLTSHLERRRSAVILVHVCSALPILAIGLTLGITGFQQATLGLFLVLFAVFSLALGLVLPVWQNYLTKIFSESRVVPAMAVLMISQSVGKLVGSLLLVRVVERYSFSAPGASLVFTMVGLLFLVGSLPFLLTAEEPGARTQGLSGNLFRAAGRSSLKRTFSNRSFLLFLGTDLEYFALSGVLAFYANYATQFCGVSPALASGLFMACNYLGGMLANGLLGWANLLSRRSKYLVTKAFALSWLIVLSVHPAPWVFYAASLAFGASRGTRLMVFTPSVKRLSGQPDATLYFAAAPILALPFSTGLPLLNGAFLDRFSSLGPGAFKIMFLGMAVLSLAGLLFSTRMPSEETR
jgi:MFS family permease